MPIRRIRCEQRFGYIRHTRCEYGKYIRRIRSVYGEYILHIRSVYGEYIQTSVRIEYGEYTRDPRYSLRI